jgi:hypothetical protein
MKKLLLASMAFLFLSASVVADTGPVGRAPSLDATGAFAGPAEAWFTNVKNASGGALVSGDVVILDATEADGFSVNSTTTAGDFPHCVLAQACADDEMCKCQTYGLNAELNFTPDQNDAVVGAPAFVSESQAGKADGITSPAFSDRPIGTFVTASSATGDVSVFIRLR